MLYHTNVVFKKKHLFDCSNILTVTYLSIKYKYFLNWFYNYVPVNFIILISHTENILYIKNYQIRYEKLVLFNPTLSLLNFL